MAAERIAVIGAGLMGHGLAQVFAVGGHEVRVHDPSAAALATLHSRIAANLTLLDEDDEAVERVSGFASLAATVEGADLVVEAAPEKLELKQRLFAELDDLTPPSTILATNTSVMPVGLIAAHVRDAGRTVGTHWWNPPYLVPLVEVVQGERTDPAVVARIMEILRGVGKSPVHVKRDVPGFVGNRLQHALWREAIALVADGVADAETVDDVVKLGFGRRLAFMGPLENADYIGLRLTLDIHDQVLHDLDRTPGPSPYLAELVDRGDLGMDTGRGLREWEPGDKERMRDELLRRLRDAAREDQIA